MTLTKLDIVDNLVSEIGLKKSDAKVTVDLIFNSIKEAVSDGDSVKLSSFGNFNVRKKNARPGRNPKTGAEVPISARTVVTFKAGHKLRDML